MYVPALLPSQSVSLLHGDSDRAACANNKKKYIYSLPDFMSVF